jgi:hypothetical protein
MKGIEMENALLLIIAVSFLSGGVLGLIVGKIKGKNHEIC